MLALFLSRGRGNDDEDNAMAFNYESIGSLSNGDGNDDDNAAKQWV